MERCAHPVFQLEKQIQRRYDFSLQFRAFASEEKVGYSRSYDQMIKKKRFCMPRWHVVVGRDLLSFNRWSINSITIVFLFFARRKRFHLFSSPKLSVFDGEKSCQGWFRICLFLLCVILPHHVFRARRWSSDAAGGRPRHHVVYASLIWVCGGWCLLLCMRNEIYAWNRRHFLYTAFSFRRSD